jgi:Uncharacterized protein conserved in bacteria
MKRITSIEQQKKNPHRFSIYVDDVYFLGIDEDVLLKYSDKLAKGMEVDEEYLSKIVKAEEQNKATNCAINQLSFRSRSINEIKNKLKEKGYDDELIENSIEFLSKYGYLNDYEFAKALVKDKQAFKKAGKKLLQQELYKKGIDKALAEQVISESVDDQAEYERAMEIAEKKFRTFGSNEDKNSKYRKLSSLLMRKGYSYDIISNVIKELLI